MLFEKLGLQKQQQVPNRSSARSLSSRLVKKPYESKPKPRPKMVEASSHFQPVRKENKPISQQEFEHVVKKQKLKVGFEGKTKTEYEQECNEIVNDNTDMAELLARGQDISSIATKPSQPLPDPHKTRKQEISEKPAVRHGHPSQQRLRHPSLKRDNQKPRDRKQERKADLDLKRQMLLNKKKELLRKLEKSKQAKTPFDRGGEKQRLPRQSKASADELAKLKRLLAKKQSQIDSQSKQLKKYRDKELYEDKSDLSFISQDEQDYDALADYSERKEFYDPLDPGTSKKNEYRGLGGKKYVFKDYSSSEMEEDNNMEANYSEIEEEELYSRVIGAREDAEQLKLIQEEERRDREAGNDSDY